MTSTHAPSRPDLLAHLPQVNPAILLAAIGSITGEKDRVSGFASQLTYGFSGNGMTAELPQPAHTELIEWAADVLSDDAIYDGRDFLNVDDESFLVYAQTLVGWPSAPESLAFLREQGGFVSFVETVKRMKRPEGFKVVIVGAGMAGINLGVALDKAGFEYVVLEKKAGLGGVWWQNRYPGVGVDTPSRYYSFSWEINPEWTHAYPEGSQYLSYLERVATKYNVLPKMQFGAEVTEAVWDDEAKLWHVTYAQNGQIHTVSANAVVTAAGYLTNWQLPDVPGIESFEGDWFHSAEWNDQIDFTGKRVAVIGTGCTSVQIVDALSDKVGSLALFQRQPHWIMPSAGKEPLPESEVWCAATIPTYAAWARLHTFLPIGDANYESVRYDEEWAKTHDMSISERNDASYQVALNYLETSFADRPDLKEKLRPNFAVMGKRPVRDPGAYFDTIKRDTTTLVTSGLAEVTPKGIVDGEGVLHEVDVIIYATGFTLEYLSDWTIVGRDGVKLADKWGDSPLAFNGSMVPGFPNLFVTSGPHASAAHGGGHNFTVEAMVHYIVECLQTVVNHDAGAIEATEEAYEQWREEVYRLMEDTIWMREKRATTYYRNTKGEVILASPLRMEDFWNRLREPDLNKVVLS